MAGILCHQHMNLSSEVIPEDDVKAIGVDCLCLLLV